MAFGKASRVPKGGPPFDSSSPSLPHTSLPLLRKSAAWAWGSSMDAFNFAFSLFAIILGLSLAKVLEGFARALRRRRVVHLGWLTPMLAVFVMLDLTSFWEAGWATRKFLTPQYGMLLIGLVLCGLYYIAASIIFPGEFGDRDDFDEHYIEHRRQVLGAIILPT